MKKIMSSVMFASVLLVSASSSTFANEEGSRSFAAFVFTPTTADGTIEGYEFEGSGMLGLVLGNKNLFSDSLGLYGSYDMSYNSVDETETSNEAIYGYRIFNVGVTYSLFDSVTLLGGVGMSWEYGEFFYYGTHYKTKEDKTDMNIHAGLTYEITDKYGAIVTYNTASSSIGVGFVGSF